MSGPGRQRIALRCDGGGSLGVGHVMRCMALGEELAERGREVLLWGNLGGVGWLEGLVADHGYAVLPAPADPVECARMADELELHAVVLDGYQLDPGTGSALTATSRRVLAMVDYDFGVQQRADVYVDQNLGARRHPDLPGGVVDLSGIVYALFRDSILRRIREEPLATTGRPHIVAAFGGTDPFNAAPPVISALLATGSPMAVDVVAGRAEPATAIRRLATAPGQDVNVVAPTRDFGALCAAADLVVSASGSSVWELLCMGVPAAVVCVIDNQEQGYRSAVEKGVVTGLGTLADFDAATATSRLATLLDDSDARDRPARRGRELVDGRGRVRVVDALLS